MPARRPTLCLLPGLDGTGRLYRRLECHLAEDFDLLRLSYDSKRFCGYERLAEELTRQLPVEREFVLIAESFAGPLAVMLAARASQAPRAMVLAASFVCSPLPASRLIAGIVGRVPAVLPPGLLLERVLAGRTADTGLSAELRTVVRLLPYEILRRRALAALKVDVRPTLARLRLPLLYLSGIRDRLIWPRAGRTVIEHAHDAELVRIDAPHFIFQTAPREAADIVRAFLRRRLDI